MTGHRARGDLEMCSECRHDVCLVGKTFDIQENKATKQLCSFNESLLLIPPEKVQPAIGVHLRLAR